MKRATMPHDWPHPAPIPAIGYAPRWAMLAPVVLAAAILASGGCKSDRVSGVDFPYHGQILMPDGTNAPHVPGEPL